MRKLHLGCFDCVVEGWINTDLTPHLFVARVPGLAFLLHQAGIIPEPRYRQHQAGIFRQVRYLDVTRRFPFLDSTFDHIYASHVLEHLTPQGAAACLRECHRVLNSNGVLRLAVPDLDELVRRFDPRQPQNFLKKIFEADQKRAKDRHHWHYNQHSLGALLGETGFRTVRRCSYRQGQLADLEKIEIRPESLFMEAVK